MESKRSVVSRNFVLVVFCTLAMIAVVAGFVIYMIRPVTDLKSAGVQASQLFASVGGPDKVCDEASQVFRRFGVSKQKFLNASELKDYPAINGLGTVGRICIYPGSPPYLAIRVGTHLNGFTIEIADTNSPEKYPKSLSTLELVDSCVFVHR